MQDTKREERRVKRLVFGILAGLLAAILAAGLVYHSQHSFTTKKWLAAPEKRTKIVSDLLEDHQLIGMSEAEVLALLGQHNNDYGYFNQDNRFVYYMGPERGLFSIDSEWLLLEFSDGVVAEWKITTD